MIKQEMLISIFMFLIIFTVNSVSADAEQVIKILVNGKELETDVDAMIIEGRTMVPLRTVFEALDVTVEWMQETRTIIGKKDKTEISLQLDSKIAKVNNEEITLDVAATAGNGRTLVPLRFIAESIHANVEWEQDTRTVKITTNVDIKETDSEETVGLRVEANPENILYTIKHLSREPRVAGSVFEKEMSAFYTDVFKSYSYEVELQEFPFKIWSCPGLLNVV